MSIYTFTMYWPTYPTLTPTGKVSNSKNAGKPLPWLSANVVGNLGRRQHRALVTMWRDQAAEAAATVRSVGILPCYLDVVLYRPRARMDSYAILEGMKPIIDGMVDAGVFPDDTQEFIRGGIARSVKSPTPGLHVVFRPALEVDGSRSGFVWASAPLPAGS